MVTQNLVYYWHTEKNIQEEMLQKIDEGMNDKAAKVTSVLADIITYARSYERNEALYRYLDHEYGGDLEFLIRYQEALRTVFENSGIYSVQLRMVCVYTENETMFKSSYVRRTDDIEDEALGEKLTYLNVEAVGKDGDFLFRVAHEDKRFQGVQDSRSVSILGEMDYYKQYSRYGKLLRLDIDTEYLEDILQESNLFDNMLLVDSENRIVVAASGYSNRGEPEGFDIEEFRRKGDMVLLERQIGDFPLTLYGIYDPGLISEEFRQSRRMSIGISVLCLLFAAVCVFAITGNINRRLRRLVEQSEEIAKGNFVLTGEKGEDEFGILGKSLDQMSMRLQELIEKEYKAEMARIELEKETNQSKLLALQSQVNPHFMFNALESIRLKALAKGERETAGVIKYMAKMFRNLIEWEDNIITLREEIGFLDEFFHIQRYRFEDEFSYEVDVQEEAYSCLIPKMILQPLVENACVHGVGAVSENRWVRLEACVRGDWLCLRVEDNGGGMPPEKLEELKRMLKGEARAAKSVGVWNVYRRLALSYGEAFRFDMESTQGKGTVCEIKIPAASKPGQEGLCIPS